MGLLVIYDKSIICTSYLQHETYWNIMQPLSLLCWPFSHFPLLFQPMFRHFGAWTSESPWSLPPSGRTKLRNWHKTGLLVTTTVTVLLGWWDLYKLLMLTLWWNIFLWNFFKLLLTLLLVTHYGDQQDIRSNLVNGRSMKPMKLKIHLSRHFEATAHKKDRACAARLHFSAVRSLDDSKQVASHSRKQLRHQQSYPEGSWSSDQANMSASKPTQLKFVWVKAGIWWVFVSVVISCSNEVQN